LAIRFCRSAKNTLFGLLATAALILGSKARAEPDPPHSFVVELWTDTGLTALTDRGSTVDFGEVAKFADTTRIFTIRNLGTTLLTNLAITKGGTHQGEFSVGTPDKTALNPGQSASFNVRFSPFGKGPREATLDIASNEFQATPFDIALVGRGVPPPGSRTTITFSTFPGMDNILGNADDIRVLPPWPPSSAVWFTNEYAHLAGGVGVVVDSKTTTVNQNLGAIVKANWNYWGLDNVLVQARADAGPDKFSYGAVDYRFVNSADGVTPAVATRVEFDFVPGISPGATSTARFYGPSGNLLHTAIYGDGANLPRIVYANSAGIAKVSITTNISAATDNFTFEAPAIVAGPPEPLNLDSGTFSVTGHAPGSWHYFEVMVPDNIVGWDVRVKDVNGGIPTLLVSRDEPPEFRDTMGWPSSPWGDEPSVYPLWPGGAIWRGGIDWTRFSYDEYLSFLGERLVMGMGRPLEPGTFPETTTSQ